MLVFAGSSQLVATQLIGHEASLPIIVLTTFIINLRNFLYSASLAAFFRPLSGVWKGLLAYPLSDENYATVITRKQQGEISPYDLAWFMAGSSLNLISAWWLSTALGALLGNLMPTYLVESLSFTGPLIFTSLIIPLLVSRSTLGAALSAALAGILLDPLPHNLGLLIAALTGIGVGVWLERWEHFPLSSPRSLHSVSSLKE
jgi:predicted branched-subunit amino acid permease